MLLNQEKAKEIEAYYAKCADEGSTKEDIAKSKKAMSSLEMILGEPDRLEKLAVDIHDHYVSSVANDPDRVQKAMIVCSNRKIAYDLLLKFKAHYPEWFDERKTPEGVKVSPEELKELKEMPTIAMVASVGSNDTADMYDYLGGVKNDQRSEELDAAFKQVHSNFRIVIVVDMWITGFDVECLTYMYNDKPLQKHSLIQTISRANRKYPGKEYGLIVDYIGIRDQMMEARKMYGGDNSVALTEDDIEQATLIFREYMKILKALFRNYDLNPFLNPDTDPATRYTLLANAAEFVFSSNENFNSVSKDGKKTKKVTFKTYFLQNVKRMRKAYDLCQPSGELGEEESALAQCFMAIAGMVYKMNGTDAPDTDTMNRRVAKMVGEALKYNKVESILEDGEEMDIFGPEFTERLEDIKMPASKLEMLIKLLRKQITEYGRTNQVASKKFQELLEATISQYHERRKFLTEQEAGSTQEETAESIIKTATEQALGILKAMQADRESFRKLGLTFEEKAFYDILIHLRDKNNFEYGEDKEVDGIVINDKCKSLACKIRDIIDAKSSFADWLNNQRIRDQLKLDIKICLVKNGYPPQYTPEVFREVMEQVENFKENELVDYNESGSSTRVVSMYPKYEEDGLMMAAEYIYIYGSIPVDLPNTKRDELTAGSLDLILMYAIGSSARQKTEAAGKIALGLKEDMLINEQTAAYKSIKYLMFHYWSNPTAYQLLKKPTLVDKNAIPSDYLLRMEKNAVKFLLLDYNPQQPANLGDINILKTQRKGEIRYLPFVTTLESIIDE